MKTPFPDFLSPETWDHLDYLAAGAARPERVRERLADWFQAEGDPQRRAILVKALEDPRWRQRLAATLGNSSYLGTVFARWPGIFPWLVEGAYAPGPAERKEALIREVLECADAQVVKSLMRRFKHREFFRIGMRDLGGEASLEEVTGDLTRVAEATLEAGFQWLHREQSQRFGQPLTETERGRQPARFVILGMGKLGAGELNFSSDIDLIFLYDEDNGHTDGPQAMAVKSYYSRLGRDLMKLMHEKTADGIVFRTDLRLRPEGESGDLCLSCRSAEIYYESWGQTWERAAMIKARPVAGDIALGEWFLQRLRPFIYRRFLDFAALDAIRDMKGRIDHKVSRGGNYLRNIKLGRGGIREIEFFVQCQQLVHGGKEPRLRGRETVAGLTRLQELGFIDADTSQRLIRGYRFLRRLEHRIQIEREEQTHLMPEEPERLQRLARRMELSDAATLLERLREVTDEVHAVFQALFHETVSSGDFGEVDALLECEIEAGECPGELAKAGFLDLEGAILGLRFLRSGLAGGSLVLRESARRWWHRLIPQLLQRILRAPDPDMALGHVQEFLSGIRNRVNYLALLVENPRVLDLLMPLFGTSSFLSRFLIRNPSLLDSLVTREFLERYRDRSQMSRDLSERLEALKTHEERLDALREFKNVELLRLGLRDLSGLAELPEVMTGLSALADVVLTQVFLLAVEEMRAKHGKPCCTDNHGVRREAAFAILAMGKLGGGELNYASDLDLIFIHDSQGDDAWSDGEKSLSNGQYFAKLGQRIIVGITTVTRSGKLYELDMRLRPSGKSGPVVTSLDSFVHYQNTEAWTWEHQALTRARVVVGDPALGAKLRSEILTVLQKPREEAKVRSDILDMRQRLWHEKAPAEGVIDIKQSRGGVVDIEFLVQYFILTHGERYPKIVQRHAGNALRALREQGLLSPTDGQRLEENYAFLRTVENRLRLLYDRAENSLRRNAVQNNRLARLCGMASGELLWETLTRRLEETHEVVARIFATNVEKTA
ncbi:MAG: bifunctional [glutamate--ammonia ligase]-adenylyl-L-tyrosine phosphorylase/[glutamate--ammonia-ligase] adenylyltransferase [Magnetococcales bacterium]|nr:bifunctional [glutamate--ammonia ligase]-adenylyl-L-tyrosine phosphorylase/[glutamate--ammonia-ligase] adenylyltransferase [Magnetococcales bacterium]